MIQVLAHRLGSPEFSAPQVAEQVARRGNRRRLAVFAGVFVVCLVLGQLWNLVRPDEYRASARIQLSLPEPGAPAAVASTAQLTQLQILNSRPLLEKVARALTQAGQPLPGEGDAAVSRLQAMLQVDPVPGSDVVRLQAVGEDPVLLARVLNTLHEQARNEWVARQGSAADAALTGERQELQRLEMTAAERRSKLEQFRNQAGLLAERDENDAVARSRGLSNALNSALEKEAVAEARVRALNDGAQAGRAGVQARDDPTLASMEARASQVREELRDMERSYTPDFMAIEPRARALRARLAELERQIAEQRVTGSAAALQAAQDDLASARALVERLRGQAAAAKPLLQGASARIAQAKLMEDDLAQVEKARRETLERVARLEASERRRVPTVTVLEAAVVPSAPFRPDRVRDGAWVLAGALLLALAATVTVELFNRAPAAALGHATTTVLMPALPGSAATALPGAVPWLPVAAGPMAPALPAPPQVLSQAEAAALLAAAQGTTRQLCAAALMGLSTAELSALRCQDVAGCQLVVRGGWSRKLPLPEWLAASLPATAAPDAPWLHDASGEALAEADFQALLAGAAVDAGLPQGAALTLEVLRNTCIDWLVGQGLRFADLPGWVGRMEADRVAAFAARASDSPRRPAHEVTFLMPALRLPPPA